MIKAVIKGNYVKGKNGVARARAHISYIGSRPGDDKDKETGRSFFSSERDEVGRAEVYEAINGQDSRGAIMHRLVMSPGDNSVDLKGFVRESMQKLGDHKGQSLNWFAVEHKNTDHDHAHVCVMGTDRDGGKVKFNRNDYKQLRDIGDKQLDRDLGLERYLPSEVRDLLASKDFNRLDDNWLEGELDKYKYGKGREQKDANYAFDDERLSKELEKLGLNKGEEKDQGLKDRLEFDQIEKELKKLFGDRAQEIPRMTGKQFQTEKAGKHLEFHEDVQRAKSIEYWSGLGREVDADMVDDIASELVRLRRMERDSKEERSGKNDFDHLMNDFDLNMEGEKLEIDNLFLGESSFDQIEESDSDISEEENRIDLDELEPTLEDLIKPLDELESEVERDEPSSLEKEKEDIENAEIDDEDSKDFDPNDMLDSLIDDADDRDKIEPEKEGKSQDIDDVDSGEIESEVSEDMESDSESDTGFEIDGTMEGTSGEGDRGDDSEL